MSLELESLLRVARGDAPADLVLRNARLVNVFTGAIEETDVAIAGARLAGIGRGYRGEREEDLGGRYLAPGLIDAHVHIESSLVTPSQFARAVVPRGVTSVVTDPHEIANVCGLAGIRWMIADAARTPLAVFVNASSCVPATPLGTAGAALDAEDLAELRGEAAVLGLAEVMNFPGVVHGDPQVLAKLHAFAGRVLDGHAPGLSGAALNAYVAAGISSDHECTTVAEAREKLARGLAVFLREATNAHNLETLLPVLDRWTERRLCLCTDDRVPADLLDQGSIDHLVRLAIERGVEPVTALRLGSLNTAEHYRMDDRGAVAPGRRADLWVFSDLAAPRAEAVYLGGRLVAEDGVALFAPEATAGGAGSVAGTVHVDWSAVDLAIPAAGVEQVRVIGLVPDQLITEHLRLPAPRAGGEVVADPSRDLLKIAVIERHRGTGNVGKGLVQGFGLGRGALAGTFAHDHHNLVVVGADDRSMTTAARAVAEAGGGLAVADGERLLGLLPLPVAGLMSDRPLEEVRRAMDGLLAAARDLGSPLHDPFMALSFVTLEVIPALKITDQGLVDVERFARVPLAV